MRHTPEDIEQTLSSSELLPTSYLVLSRLSKTKRISVLNIAQANITAIDNNTYLDDMVQTNWLTPLQNISDQTLGKADVSHTHTKESIGLGNVQNISPALLPISTAQQLALDTKALSPRTISELPVTPQW